MTLPWLPWLLRQTIYLESVNFALLLWIATFDRLFGTPRHFSVHMLVDLPFHCLYMAHCYLIHNPWHEAILQAPQFQLPRQANPVNRLKAFIHFLCCLMDPTCDLQVLCVPAPKALYWLLLYSWNLFSAQGEVKVGQLSLPKNKASRLHRLKLHPAPIHELLKNTQDCLNCFSAWISECKIIHNAPLNDTPGPAFSAALILISIASTNRIGDIAQPIGIPTS